MPGKVVSLLSGGLDSCVSTTWAVQVFGLDNVIPCSISYGQRHAREIASAVRICDTLGLPAPIPLNLVNLFAVIGGSSLTSGIREGNPSSEEVSRPESDLPPTFVPGRNILMISAAASLGYVRGATGVVGGWNILDYSGYPDCRPEFLRALSSALSIGLGIKHAKGHTVIRHEDPVRLWEDSLSILAPIVQLTKTEIIQLGLQLNAPLAASWSCYAGDSTPCGVCDSCKIRAAGFSELGIPDPAVQ